MSENVEDVIVQISVAGNAETGKTTFCHRLLNNVSYRNENDYAPTIGLDFMATKYTFPSSLKAKVHIWDFSGKQSYNGIICSYFASCCASIFFCDVTNKSSVEDLYKWYDTLEKKIGRRIQSYPVIVVGNITELAKHNDLLDESKKQTHKSAFQKYIRDSKKMLVKPEQKLIDYTTLAKGFANRYGLVYVDLDMREYGNVQLVWNTLMQSIYNLLLIRRTNLPGIEYKERKTISVDESNKTNVMLLQNKPTPCCSIL